jgi:D-beta-D-heptose 7-phosphate kinase/D-beta-D-heptose 1-phosphate adenosyltransferase
VICTRVLRRILPLARRQKKPIVVDPKVQHFHLYKGATVVTPNHHEASAFARVPVRGEADLLAVGRLLLRELDVGGVVVTRGGEGMSVFEGRRVTHIPAVGKEVYDVTGAGDTVVASLGLALASGASLEEAAVIANHAAGIVVGKVGTATVGRQELLDSFERHRARLRVQRTDVGVRATRAGGSGGATGGTWKGG